MRGAIAIAVIGMLVLAGCSNETAGPSVSDYEAAKRQAAARDRQRAEGKAPARKPKPAPTQVAEAAPAEGEGGMTSSQGFEYDPRGKRDPFRSFILERAKEAAADAGGPLQEFELSQLAVLAVIWDTDAPRALISDPSGRGYIVGVGTSVGKNDGKVIGIRDNLVLVKETYVNWLNERTTKDIEMRIHSQGKGGDF